MALHSDRRSDPDRHRETRHAVPCGRRGSLVGVSRGGRARGRRARSTFKRRLHNYPGEGPNHMQL
eukprot:1821212-Pyramimonas_sp.AAC.1